MAHITMTPIMAMAILLFMSIIITINIQSQLIMFLTTPTPWTTCRNTPTIILRLGVGKTWMEKTTFLAVKQVPSELGDIISRANRTYDSHVHIYIHHLVFFLKYLCISQKQVYTYRIIHCRASIYITQYIHITSCIHSISYTNTLHIVYIHTHTVYAIVYSSYIYIYYNYNPYTYLYTCV